MARRGQRQTGARRTAPRNQRRDRDRDDVISVLARAVREVEAAAQRGPVTPAVRTKFQVVALLVREEHARVRAEETSSDAHRAEQLKRLDGIATILAKTAVRDPALLALLAEDAVVSDAARSLKRDMLRAARHRAGPRGGRAGGARGRPRRHRAPGRAAVGRLAAAGQPVPRPRLRGRPADHGPSAPPGRLGAARPAAQFVRARRRRSLGVHGPSRAVLPARAGWPGADAAPGAGGRRRRGRPPDLPARRRAGPGQDGSGAARRGGGERLPAARGRAERRQDQLGPRGRPLDAPPLGHRDPRQRRHDRRLRRHRRRQLRGARPPRGLDRRLRLPRHGRRRGALHQEQDLAALAARPGALRAHPVPDRAAPADGPDRHPADQRHRGLPGHLAVPRLDRRDEAAAAS